MAKIILNKGNSKDRFGHKDLEANLKAGVKYSEILEYLKKNPDKLWSGNKKGKPGGLYDLVSSKTQEEYKDKGEEKQKDQLKIDNEVVKGGYTRVDDDEFTDDQFTDEKDIEFEENYFATIDKKEIFNKVDQSERIMMEVGLYFQEYNNIIDDKKIQLYKKIEDDTNLSTRLILFAFLLQLIIFIIVQVFELRELRWEEAL